MKYKKVTSSNKRLAKVYGPGTIISSITGAFGIQKCADCDEREKKINDKAHKLAVALGIRKE